MTTVRDVEFEIEGQVHQGRLVAHQGPARPTVLVFHAWDGRSAGVDAMADRVLGLGWNAFSADLYGKGVRGDSVESCQALMTPLLNDRARLRRSILRNVEVVTDQPEVDAGRLAAIGFCFGGLCVLDLARANGPVRGVASFHGLFTPPGLPEGPVSPKVVAFHGWNDPMAPPEAVLGFAAEFTRLGADWRLEAFGDTLHGFMMEGANNPALGVAYNAVSANRAWKGLVGFLEEALSA